MCELESSVRSRFTRAVLYLAIPACDTQIVQLIPADGGVGRMCSP